MAGRRFPRGRGRGGAILIIAEDPLAREVYGELFAMRGHAVVTAGNARDGLRRARDRAITTAVLAVHAGTAQLRRKLHALRPSLRVHVTGMMPLPLEAMRAPARQHLH